MRTQAQASPGGYALSGSKTWISNGSNADLHITFAKTEPEAGTCGITAFLVDANTAGLDCSQHIAVMAPHALSTLVFSNCLLPTDCPLSTLNGGFKLAMQTLDIFRASVVYFPGGPYTPAGLVQRIYDVGATIGYTAPTFYQQMAPCATQHGPPADLR